MKREFKEKDEFDVKLTEIGTNKVKVIKVVREATDLGLKEAKEVVDSAPKVIKEAASKAEAEEIKTKLVTAPPPVQPSGLRPADWRRLSLHTQLLSEA